MSDYTINTLILKYVQTMMFPWRVVTTTVIILTILLTSTNCVLQCCKGEYVSSSWANDERFQY
jgi:hypothetical protein